MAFSVSFLLLVFSSLFVVSLQEKRVLAKDMTFKLNTGDQMPMVGFGTYQIQGTELIRKVIDFALASGYRLIDTAALYKNEEDIGKALKELLPKYNLTRKDIFITTKLYPYNRGEKAYESLLQSLRYLDCEYIDLYLIHWPGVLGANLTASELRKSRDDGWQQLVEGKKNGLTRNIGVSNYNIGHLTELMKNNHGVVPAVNQVEWHPKYHSDDLLEFCGKEGILLQGYSSLGGTDNKDLLDNSDVKKIAEKLGKTPAQNFEELEQRTADRKKKLREYGITLQPFATIVGPLDNPKESVVPGVWKIAVVQVLPKKSDPMEFKDLRVIQTQLKNHLEHYSLLPEIQSGFRNTIVVPLLYSRLLMTSSEPRTKVLLRWALQQNIAIIPKARSKKYIEQNIDLNFSIPEVDMSILNNFKRKQYAWDPDTIV